MLISLRKQAMTTPKIRAAIHASNVPAWMLERVGPDRILESERLRHALAERYGISEQTVWIGRQDEAARAACRYRSSWAYRSFWKFWQASAPATIRRLLRPRHPFPSIARLPLRLWLAPEPLQHRAEVLPGHDGVDLDQRVPLGIQARVAV